MSMTKGHVIIELKKLLETKSIFNSNTYDIESTGNIDTTKTAQNIFDDLETIFNIYLGVDVLKDDKELYSKVIEAKNAGISALEKELKAKPLLPSEITLNHKFDLLDTDNENLLIKLAYLQGPLSNGTLKRWLKDNK